MRYTYLKHKNITMNPNLYYVIHPPTRIRHKHHIAKTHNYNLVTMSEIFKYSAILSI